MRKGVRALILSPTRELASQIAESFRTYGRHMGLSVAVVYGGVGHKPQRDQLSRGVDILVATPGRLIDHMMERNVVLEGTEILVLDEADQMMDLGFIRPLRQIVSKLSHRRQSLFFSATMPQEIGALAAELLKDPVKVSVSPVSKTADRVAQEVIFIEQTRKRALLAELFTNPDMKRAIVFTRTKRGADKVARYLEVAGVPVAAIHGNKSQGQRDHALSGFKAGKIRALIATDIAARGIDVDAVSHVVNFEVPNVPESYVHRIGRTARAGAEGIAISLVDNEERGYLRDIERLTRQQIPSKDRRGDTSLVVAPETAADRKAEAESRPRFARGDRRGDGAGRSSREGGRDGRRDSGRDSGREGSRQEGRGGPRSEGRGSDRNFADRQGGDRRPPARDRNRDDARPSGNNADRAQGHAAGRPAEGGEARRPASRFNARDDRRPRNENGPRSEGGHRGGGDSLRAEGEGRARQPNGEARAPYHAHGEGRPRHPGAHRGADGVKGPARSHDRSERHDRPDRSARPDHAGRADRAARQDRPDRTERPDRNDRPGAKSGNGHHSGGRSGGSAGTGGGNRGLEGVHFLNNRGGQRPGAGKSGPRANDRQRARPRPA